MSKHHWYRFLQFVLGFGAVFLAAKLVGPLSLHFQQRSLPAGWRIIRPPHEVSALAVREDLLWAGGTGGLSPVDRASGERVSVPGMPRLSAVRDIVVSRDGVLWAAHRDGLTRWDGRQWKTLRDGGLPAGPLMALFETRDGRLYVGGEAGLSVMEGTTIRHVASSSRLGLAGLDLIYGDPAAGAAAGDGAGGDGDGDGNGDVLWLASSAPTGGGIVRFRECGPGRPACPDGGQGARAFDIESWTGRAGMPHPSVSAVLRARDGTLWFGTGFGRRGGAIGWKDGGHRVMTREQELAGEKVRSLYEDRAGRFWIGSEYDGIAILEGGRRRVLTPESGLAGWEVKEMIEDPDGVLWLATEDGVSRIEGFR